MDTKTMIYLVRHGQTEWNVKHRFQGHQDSPLTELGVKQARWLGESLRNERLDVIYSSSSPRARRTAEFIRDVREMEIDILESHDLKEMNLGVWEGEVQEEMEKRYPVPFTHFWNDPEKFRVEGSETFLEVSKRAIRTLHQILRMHQGKAILIVTHTVVVKLIMAYFEERPMKDIWHPPYIHPTGLCKVGIEGNKPEIILYGDTSHLPAQNVSFHD